jgi:catechol 2,3-dioxygenase-like lactoylglutathione lyase family enzyme
MSTGSDFAAITSTGGLNHMGFVVADLEKSHDFYVDVVGMKEEGLSDVGSPAFDKLMERFNVLMGTKDRYIKYWYLSLDGFRLQLVEYLSGAGEDLELDHNKRGCPHLCFEVDDAKEKFEEIAARGDVKIVTDLVTHEYGDMVAHSFYVEDPDGMPIEFGQLERAA